jgi:hypothetical protein
MSDALPVIIYRPLSVLQLGSIQQGTLRLLCVWGTLGIPSRWYQRVRYVPLQGRVWYPGLCSGETSEERKEKENARRLWQVLVACCQELITHTVRPPRRASVQPVGMHDV